MKNLKIIEEVDVFCEEIAILINDHVLKEDFDMTEDDAWILEELSLRNSISVLPNNFFYLGFDLPESLINMVEDVEDIAVTVVVYRNVDRFSISADNCPLDGSGVGMHINVFLPEDLSDPTVTSLLMKEIVNTVRHEMEHVIQQEFPELVDYLDYHKIDFKIEQIPSHLCLYLVQPSEVSAHVRGYQKTTQGILSFAKVVGNLLEGYVSQGQITKEEKSSVFWCWKDWYDRNTYIDKSESVKCAM